MPNAPVNDMPSSACTWPTLWVYLMAQLVASAAAGSLSSRSTPTISNPAEGARSSRTRRHDSRDVLGTSPCLSPGEEVGQVDEAQVIFRGICRNCLGGAR
jgi:hypothetical protein